jgi:hypothetical protein
MTKEDLIIQPIENKIYFIRNQKVMLDSDLAEIYGVETRVLNQAVKRNRERFPESFMFQINENEHNSIRSQIVTLETNSLRSQTVILNAKESKRGKHTKFSPYVFTEHGAVMLASVLRSETAIKASVKVVSAFVELRRFIENNAGLFQRLNMVEKRMTVTEDKVDKVYKALESDELKLKQGIFFEGQVFDAYSFVANLTRKARKSIILIDNYIDDTVLTLFSKRKKGVQLTIYTKTINKQLSLDLQKHNEQYDFVQVKEFKAAHDRFLLIDEIELYHIGASLKDLGKKWFAFSKMDTETINLLEKLGKNK